MNLLAEGLAALERGWILIRLSPPDDSKGSPGKRPIDDAWQNSPQPSTDTLKRWVKRGYNLGLVTCREPDPIVVVDVDQSELPPWLPPTRLVRTGSGKWHAYYSGIAPGSNEKQLPGTTVAGQIRGIGGQVVFVGSTHASGGVYQWANDLPIAPFAEYLRAVSELPPPTALDWSHPPLNPRYASRALSDELARVSSATEGARNSTLFKAAAALSELVNGGVLDDMSTREALYAAARATGLDEKEITTTMRSAWRTTRGKARGPKARATPIPDHAPDILHPDVLVPGAHCTSSGEYIEATPESFATQAINAQPPYTLFKRGGVVGVIEDGAFLPLTNDGIRIFARAKPCQWRRIKDEQAADGWSHVKQYVPLSKEHAGLIIARSTSHPNVSAIRLITRVPLFLGPKKITVPGWNPGGVWLESPPPTAKPVDPVALFDDILGDFPWQDRADMENYIGGVLSVIVRPWIDGNVPMHFVSSTIERTGKTLLAEQILGGITLGRPTPAMQFAGSDEERDKRILAVLLRGIPVVHLDNLTHWMDSAALASLLTASVYTGRILGQSLMAEVENLSCFWATGNNVNATGEIAKRSIPIRLVPPDAEPHMRSSFRHPDIAAYVRERQPIIVATLLDMVERWIAAGEPDCGVTIGGFRSWCRIVGGAMHYAGFRSWMANYRAWTGATDVEGTDLERFVVDWAERAVGPQKPSELRLRASEMGLFERTLGKAATDRGMDTAFAAMLRRNLNRVIAGQRIVERVDRKGRLYALEAIVT